VGLAPTSAKQSKSPSAPTDAAIAAAAWLDDQVRAGLLRPALDEAELATVASVLCKPVNGIGPPALHVGRERLR